MDDRYWSDFAAYYSDDMDEGCRISYKMPLGRLGLKKGDKFKYLFDFGDEWRFQCRVMQELEEKTRNSRVIKSVEDSPAQYPDWDDEELLRLLDDTLTGMRAEVRHRMRAMSKGMSRETMNGND